MFLDVSHLSLVLVSEVVVNISEKAFQLLEKVDTEVILTVLAPDVVDFLLQLLGEGCLPCHLEHGGIGYKRQVCWLYALDLPKTPVLKTVKPSSDVFSQTVVRP